jgi:tetratricopeptide (TPR) repeat protein
MPSFKAIANNAQNAIGWLPYLDLICVTMAGGLWYALPNIGAWPLILALVPWALRLVLTGRLGRRTRFDLPLLLFLLTAGLAVWAAYNRQVAWSKFWLIAGGILLFYALVNAKAVAEGRLWVLAFLGAGISIAFVATHDWSTYPAKIGILTHVGQGFQRTLSLSPKSQRISNEVGGIVAMLLPFIVLLVVQRWHRVQRVSQSAPAGQWLALMASLALLALTAFGLLMSTSRGAWLALGSALVLLALWVVAGRVSHKLDRRRTWVFVALLVPVVAVGLAVAMAQPGGITGVLSALPGRDTWQSRVQFHQYSQILAHDYPFIGAGLAGFQMLYSTYALLIHVGFIPHSHSLYLSVAIDQGFVALLILIWMWLLFAWVVWQELLEPQPAEASKSPALAGLGAAALSLVVVLVHGIAENALYSREGILFLFVPLAFAATLTAKRNTRAGRWMMPGLPICALLLASILALTWHPLSSLFYSNLGAVHQSRTELSVYSWPEWPVQDAVRRAVDLSQPIEEFERALELDPSNTSANRRLGMIELSLGEYEDALRHLERAYAGEPESMTTQQLLGEAFIVNGQFDEGQALWSGVSNSEGQLTLRAFWYRHIGDDERAEWIQQATRGQ